MRRRVNRCGALALAVTAGLSLSACTGSSAPPSQRPSSARSRVGAITVARARRVVSSTMATNNQANARLDSHLLATYEAGSAFTIDRATYSALHRAEREGASSAGAISQPFSVDVTDVAVSGRGRTGGEFLAEGDLKATGSHAPSSPRCGTVFDFERASPGASWHIVLEPTVGATPPRLARTAKGLERQLPGSLLRSAKRLPERVAKAFLAEETSGRLGPFKKGDFTGKCWQLPNPRVDVIGADQSGFVQRDIFSARGAAPVAFLLEGGHALVIFTLRFDDQMMAASASTPIPWSHASLSKNPGAAWTYLLPAGHYSRIDERGQLEVAANLSPGGKYVIVGSYEGVTQLTGRRAKASSTNQGGTLTGYRTGDGVTGFRYRGEGTP